MSNQPATLEPFPAAHAAMSPPPTIGAPQAAPPGKASASEAPPPAPLSVTASRLLTTWMADQRISLAFTTYQSGKLILLGRTPDLKTAHVSRNLARAMGLHATATELYVSAWYQLWRFANALEPGEEHQGHDRLFVPRQSWVTGDLDIHDLSIDSKGRPVFVSTMFGCLATVDDRHSLRPIWKPPFLSRLAAEDRCHLNGLAMLDGRPKYVTAVARTDAVDAWREHRREGGCVVDVESGEIVVGGLSMPHSPRIYRGKLWVLNSGAGWFGWVDLNRGEFVPLTFCPGYARGLAFHGDYAVVGLSAARKHKTFSGLELDDNLKVKGASAWCGALVIDLRTGDAVHWLRFEGADIEELYDVGVVPGCARPYVIGFQTDEIKLHVTLPHEFHSRGVGNVSTPSSQITAAPDRNGGARHSPAKLDGGQGPRPSVKLDSEFIRLPLQFDAERLRSEIGQFTEQDWRPHPQGFTGNWALPLISAHGNPDNDAVKGPMLSTPYLDRCPYLKQVLASFHSVLGRTRLMRLDNEAETTAHVDTSYYWLTHVRVHVPIVTYPEVRFHCGARHLHMAAGECWLFDTWKVHNVLNPTPHLRVHLVADTVGSPAFWDLVRRGQRPFGAEPAEPFRERPVPYREGESPALEFERTNFPVVMPPDEQRHLADWFLGELQEAGQHPRLVASLCERVQRFLQEWKALWDRHGDRESGWPAYRALLGDLGRDLGAFEALPMPNSIAASEVFWQGLVRPALNPELAGGKALPELASVPEYLNAKPAGAASSAARDRQAPVARAAADEPRIEKPVIIVASPRSGSSLLFETLSRSPDLHTIGGESHQIIERFADLRPSAHDWDSNRLTAEDASPSVRQLLPRAFLAQMRGPRGVPAKGAVRLLEKTPKNALRVPFLKAVFPDARFIYLYREPRGNLNSIIEAWRSARFVTYGELPGWTARAWSLLLIPGWRELAGTPVEEIALRQWTVANETILSDLSQLLPEDWCVADYDTFVARPQGEYERLCRFIDADPGAALGGPLPNARHTLTPPDPDKWKKNAAELARVLPATESLAARVRDLFSKAVR
jgi:uncharacterized protein (TIGR03032 family)